MLTRRRSATVENLALLLASSSSLLHSSSFLILPLSSSTSRRFSMRFSCSLVCLNLSSLSSWGSRGSVGGRALDFGLIGVSTCGFESHQGPFRSLTFPPVLRDWVIKGFGMSSLVYATGHIKDPVPLIEKRRGLSPGGRFPPSFIHHHHRTE